MPAGRHSSRDAKVQPSEVKQGNCPLISYSQQSAFSKPIKDTPAASTPGACQHQPLQRTTCTRPENNVQCCPSAKHTCGSNASNSSQNSTYPSQHYCQHHQYQSQQHLQQQQQQQYQHQQQLQKKKQQQNQELQHQQQLPQKQRQPCQHELSQHHQHQQTQHHKQYKPVTSNVQPMPYYCPKHQPKALNTAPRETSLQPGESLSSFCTPPPSKTIEHSRNSIQKKDSNAPECSRSCCRSNTTVGIVNHKAYPERKSDLNASLINANTDALDKHSGTNNQPKSSTKSKSEISKKSKFKLPNKNKENDDRDATLSNKQTDKKILDHHPVTAIPQTNMSIGLLVFCCFNPPLGALAIYLSLTSAKAYRDGNQERGASRAHWSIIMSLFGIMITMVVVSSLVVFFAINKHAGAKDHTGMSKSLPQGL